MAAITIRNLDDPLKARLRISAAQRGSSMVEEARRILREALAAPAAETDLGTRLHQRVLEVPSLRPRPAPSHAQPLHSATTSRDPARHQRRLRVSVDAAGAPRDALKAIDTCRRTCFLIIT